MIIVKLVLMIPLLKILYQLKILDPLMVMLIVSILDLILLALVKISQEVVNTHRDFSSIMLLLMDI